LEQAALRASIDFCVAGRASHREQHASFSVVAPHSLSFVQPSTSIGGGVGDSLVTRHPPPETSAAPRPRKSAAKPYSRLVISLRQAT
jgi:hypothetical protein